MNINNNFFNKVYGLLKNRLNQLIEIIAIVAIMMIFLNWILNINFFEQYNKYWMFLFLVILFIIKIKNNSSEQIILLISSVSTIIIQNIYNIFYSKNFDCEQFSLSLAIILIIILLINGYVQNSDHSLGESLADDFFNLVYINSQKSYEIAMLFDDKIMTAVKKEKYISKTKETNYKFDVNSTLNASRRESEEAGNNISESFEVKNTKSTLLRKIYRSSQNVSQGFDYKLGKLLKFDNIEFKALNTQATPLLMQILQESKIDNPDLNGLELNLSSMLSNFLSDYTIDYSFKFDDKEFLVRFPYNNRDFFENGYQHGDLQLGKLTLIGIYRGEIDFSEFETISTRFLEYMSQVIRQPKKMNDQIFLESDNEPKNAEFDIDFEYQKTVGKYHLIDIIAIVQKIDKENN
ncbi:MAG: hypothetical protein E7156_02040 [Streptococcus gallolyticus]|uniref:Uncharacterized protein n=1 Tax=Streptococcus gallolyticus TaxID=315405 RepID=A0A928A7L7_9STRE|nr:hypothetical protein [Streptococcus gallolyticus]